MRTDNPEQDAQTHIMRQESFESTDECALCGATVDAEEISYKTNYHCLVCQQIDICDCGYPRDQCKYCSLPVWWRWTYNFRSNFIHFFKDLI